MSVRITGNGIEADNNFELKSLFGEIKIKGQAIDLPQKIKTRLEDGDNIVVRDGEALMTPPLTFTGDSSVEVEEGGLLIFI